MVVFVASKQCNNSHKGRDFSGGCLGSILRMIARTAYMQMSRLPSKSLAVGMEDVYAYIDHLGLNV